MQIEKFVGEQWPHGHLFVLSGLDGKTDYKEGLVIRTTQPAGIVVKDPGICQVTFTNAPQGPVYYTCDGFTYHTKDGAVKGVVVDAHHFLIEGASKIEVCEDKILTKASGNRLLIGTASKFNPSLIEQDMDSLLASHNEWFKKQKLSSKLDADESYSVFRAYSQMKGQVYSPEGEIKRRWTTPDRWPHKDMWLWDSAFHAIGWRHIDPELSKEMLDAVFDLQRQDGFIALRGWPYGREEVMTQPPILALAVKLVNEKAKDKKWLEYVYPKLAAYIEWDFANRDTDGGGMVEWYIEQHETCRSGESGLDNSSRFDSALQLDAVDFNSFLALEMEILSEIAEELGRKDDAKTWKERYKKLCSLIERDLWSDELKFYCDYNPKIKKCTDVLSCVGFLPLICGSASPERAKHLLAHLHNPETFGTKLPIPSIALCQKQYYSKDMWRGPVWINLNWFLALGLERYGMKDEAIKLREVTVKEIERTVKKYGTFFEYFDALMEDEPPKLLRKGRCAPEVSPYNQVIHNYGWTATLYLDLVLSGLSKE